jgi:TFIIF-interacting CTD phosphatase-like protein
MKIKNIILDIDETLIHCVFDNSNKNKSRYDNIFVISGIKYNIIHRPYLKEFINFIFKYFDTVNIWTAATHDYAKKIICNILHKDLTNKKYIDKLKFFNTRKHVNLDGSKELNKIFSSKYAKQLNITDKNTVMIDDKHCVFKHNKGNGIIIAPFMGSPNDTELLNLINFLKIMLEEKIVTNINDDCVKLSEVFEKYHRTN